MSDFSTIHCPPQGLFRRAIGIVVSPSETFRPVVAHPRSVGILFFACLLMAAGTGIPQLTEEGQQAALASAVQQMERFTGQPASLEQHAAMAQTASVSGYITMASVFVFTPTAAVVFSALYWVLLNVAVGGTASFGQVLSVTSHSQVITGLGALLGLPIQILLGTFSQAGPFNLGALAPAVDPTSHTALFLGTLTCFGLWQSIVCGIGLSVLYKRSPTGIVVGLLLIYLATTALFTLGLSSTMGGN